MTTWRKQLDHARTWSEFGDPVQRDESPVVAVAPGESVLDIEFDDGYGGSNGKPVLIWTGQRVYFPVVYDGAEWLGSAPRDPVTWGQAHVGGE
jgi:hypothetical protein